LEQAQRRLTIDEKQNTIWLEDSFRFGDEDHHVEDVFVTWLPVTVDGGTALIQGMRHHLQLLIEDPLGAEFAFESLVNESRANDRAEVLRRIRVKVAGATTIRVRLRLDIMPVGLSDGNTSM